MADLHDPQDGLASELTRTSARVKAKSVYIPREERVEGVAHNVEDFTQSEYLNDLYGGNYTFSAEPNPPSHEFALDQSLLGPHRFCSLGFEPLNFNTGNFFLQTQDIRLTDLGGSALEIIRTLQLTRPIFARTACYGHFGRAEFPWERENRVQALRDAVL